MKGVVFNLLEDAVQRAFGPDTWDALIETAGVSGAYTSLGDYPDSEIEALVAAAMQALLLDRDQVLRWFGQNAVLVLSQLYPSFFEAPRSADESAADVNTIIDDDAGKLDPDAGRPHLRLSDVSDHQLVMDYLSICNMCALAEGFSRRRRAVRRTRRVRARRPQPARRSALQLRDARGRGPIGRNGRAVIPGLSPISEADPATQIARLERRLAREREARLEAEAIAESGAQALYRQQERLRLIEIITNTANLDDDPAAIFTEAMREICSFTGWPIGHVYVLDDDDPSRLMSSGIWFGADEARLEAFREASTRTTFTVGVGLPGRVLASKSAAWIEDVTLDPNFPRAQAAGRSGLHGGFAFPAMIGEEVGAVVEFFQRKAVPPDPDLLDMLNRVGAQLGRVVERYRNARRLRIHNAELTALYAEAQAQKEAAEAANRAKSAFLAVTSHEVRTPLNAVLGLSEALKREPMTPAQQELNDGVLASGRMLLRLLDAVLDMSRIEANQATARLTDFDIGAKARAVVSIWTPRARELGVALRLDASGLKLLRIRQDEGRIEQTLVNLISNALKFTPAGGEVLVVASSDDARLRIEVIDDGPGVPEEDRERIFQAFEQTEAGRAAGGVGLGLSICVGNVRLLEGEIHADRAEDGRSRFWFACPVSPAAATEDVAAAAPPTAGLRVLAAEDNVGNQRVLQVLLAQAEVELTLVENGLQAVEALRQARFDLVLMDANMPVMDGTEAVRLIRAENIAGDAPVHMLTANAFAEDVDRYLAAGADGVLTKPILLPQLFAILAACREDRAARRHTA